VLIVTGTARKRPPADPILDQGFEHQAPMSLMKGENWMKKEWKTLRLLKHGDVKKVTLQCDKTTGGSDGNTFHGIPITCHS